MEIADTKNPYSIGGFHFINASVSSIFSSVSDQEDHPKNNNPDESFPSAFRELDAEAI